MTRPCDQLHGLREVVVTARDSYIEAPRCVDGSSFLCEVMATGCGGDLENVDGSTRLYEVMATACDDELEYVDGSSRVRGLGYDGDRSGDCPNDLV